MATAPSAPCDGRYKAVHNSGTRKANEIQYVVIHSEEASTAESAASYFAQQHSGASTQLAVDDTICYRCLPDLMVPWGAPPLNRTGLHIEQAGYAAWKKWKWMTHIATIKRCAWHSAVFCAAYGIPARWLDVPTLRKLGTSPGKGKGGLTSHRNVTLAFQDPNAEGHTDPGPNYPYSTYLFFVRYYLRKIKAQQKQA